MSGAKRWVSVFSSLFGGVAGTFGEAGLAELLADLDELGGQSAEALVFGDLLAGALEGVRRDGTGHGLAAGLECEGPVGTVARVTGSAQRQLALPQRRKRWLREPGPSSPMEASWEWI